MTARIVEFPKPPVCSKRGAHPCPIMLGRETVHDGASPETLKRLADTVAQVTAEEGRSFVSKSEHKRFTAMTRADAGREKGE